MRVLGWSVAALVAAAGCDGGMTAAERDAGPPDAGPILDCSGRSADAPATRGEAAGVLDAARGRILLYGGNVAAPEMCSPRYDIVEDFWAFHLDCNSWERLEILGGPGVRSRHATVLDTRRNRMILFGGRERIAFGSYRYFNDVWAFDLATDTWSEIVTNGPAPVGRAEAVIAYDHARDRLLVFGGDVDTTGMLGAIGDLWELDLASGAWREIVADDAPSPRLYHASAVVGSEWLVFGGTGGFLPPYFNDVHAFDLASDRWRVVTEHRAGAPPQPRFGAELFADVARNRAMVAFGHDDTDLGNRNDVWALDVASGSWSEMRPGDRLNGVAGGQCDFPADFTIPEEASPERRYSLVTVQDDRYAYVIGGKTDCGNTNDVFRFDLASGTWLQLRPATGGEACVRTGRTTCTTLCF